jgi:hypothetical protein
MILEVLNSIPAESTWSQGKIEAREIKKAYTSLIVWEVEEDVI